MKDGSRLSQMALKTRIKGPAKPQTGARVAARRPKSHFGPDSDPGRAKG